VAFDGMLDALESAEADAHRAEDRMRQFLADASHDLRTPLAGVIGNAELLLRANPPRAERETRLVDLVREAQRAARLVDDLLLITRLDTPQPTLRREPVALTDVADRAITLARLRRPDRTITLSATHATVSGDPDHLQRALANLLDNATTATPPGGHVTLTITTTPGQVRISVADTGPGVGEGDRHRIFDRFVRLSTARSGTGTGLGLPIARAIAAAHGGELHYLPTPAGARFDLTLPTTTVTPTPITARPHRITPLLPSR